ncbi:MAG: T9SS type A sorting domain-containing protein [Flavobacteriales bacterium]|nr:T9SS type A sorting domain-containing protein [Flavobacteriales bacterium]
MKLPSYVQGGIQNFNGIAEIGMHFEWDDATYSGNNNIFPREDDITLGTMGTARTGGIRVPFDVSATYTVTVTDPGTGCETVDEIQVIAPTYPVVDLGSSVINQCFDVNNSNNKVKLPSYVKGGIQNFNGIAEIGMHFEWDDATYSGNNNTFPREDDITPGIMGTARTGGIRVPFDVSATYTVTVTDPATECETVDEIQVIAPTYPTVTLNSDVDRCLPASPMVFPSGLTLTFGAGFIGISEAGNSFVWTNYVSTNPDFPSAETLESNSYNGGILLSEDDFGTYTVEVTGTNGCTTTADMIVTAPEDCGGGGGVGKSLLNPTNEKVTDIDSDTSIEVSVYPNPFTDQTTVMINKDGDDEQVQVQITTIGGKWISAQQQTTNVEFQIGEDLSSGLYVLHVIYADGVEITKLIKTN